MTKPFYVDPFYYDYENRLDVYPLRTLVVVADLTVVRLVLVSVASLLLLPLPLLLFVVLLLLLLLVLLMVVMLLLLALIVSGRLGGIRSLTASRPFASANE